MAFSESNSMERSDCNPAGHSLDLFFDMPTSYSFLRVTLRVIVFVGYAHSSFTANLRMVLHDLNMLSPTVP